MHEVILRVFFKKQQFQKKLSQILHSDNFLLFLLFVTFLGLFITVGFEVTTTRMRNFITMRSAMRLKAFSGLQVSLPKRSFTKIMTEKHLKRGASVQLLHPGGLPNLTNEDLVFAESFSTFSVRNAKKLDNIQETLDATGGATTNNAILDSVLETVKNILDLKIRATSTLTLERLVKKFTEDFENLSPEDKAKLFIHLATVHFINEDNLR